MALTEFLIGALVLFVAGLFERYFRFLYLANKIPNSDYDYSIKELKKSLRGDPKHNFQMMIKTFGRKNYNTKAWFGPMFNVGIVNPCDVKLVLNSKVCLDKGKLQKFVDLPKGSLFGDLEYWHTHRKIMNPYFGPQALKSVIPIFNEKTKILMEILRKMENKMEFDVLNLTMALTLETICKVMEFDVDIQKEKEEIRDSYRHNLEEMGKMISERMFKFWLYNDFIFKKTSKYQRLFDYQNKTSLKFTDDIIQNARNKLKCDENGNDEKNKSFIRALVDPKNNLALDELQDEVKTVLVAGQDTTAIASSSTLLLLAMHKDIQQKVIDELHSVFGKVTEVPYIDIDDLNQLFYLEMAFNEAMRIFPIVPFLQRTNTAELQLSDGYILPVGSGIVIPVYVLHHSKKIWGEDAELFRPERFSKENLEKVHPYGFLPYGKGPRMCIGWRYAVYSMKITLANFLLRYEVDTSLKYEEIELQSHVSLNISQGYMISIKPRVLE